MLQPGLFSPPTWTVSDLTRYIRQLLEGDEVLQEVWVRGEISNFKRATSGHIYFSLKDPNSTLQCVIWRSTAVRIHIPLDTGMAVEVHGTIGVYERDGSYQLYVSSVRVAGEGALFQEFLRLKASLEAEGLFDEERKDLFPPALNASV
jgi:exodeoxyribonuclease VII large subunit